MALSKRLLSVVPSSMAPLYAWWRVALFPKRLLLCFGSAGRELASSSTACNPAPMLVAVEGAFLGSVLTAMRSHSIRSWWLPAAARPALAGCRLYVMFTLHLRAANPLAEIWASTPPRSTGAALPSAPSVQLFYPR